MVNVRVKRSCIRSRHVWIRETSESKPLAKASKQNYDDIKTGAHSRLREEHGGYLLTDHAVSGAEEA